MHRGCQEFFNTAEIEKDDHTKLRLKTFNMIVKTIRLMFDKTKKEVQDHINIGRNQGRDFEQESIKDDSNNNSNLSSKLGKNKQGNNNGFVDEFEDEIFVTYHRFFIQPKYAILDKWKKEISEVKRMKIERKKQKGMALI